MPKQKLRRFREIKTMDFVLEYPYSVLQSEVFPYKGSWNGRFFKQEAPLTLELGCGGGEYTVALAEQNPRENYVGVDKKGDRLWHGATAVRNKNLQNVAFLRTDIDLINRFFDREEVEAIWITFPDPMMKHRRRRLISSVYFEKYRQLLKPGGIIRLKTDSPFLYQYTLDLLAINNISPLCATEDLYGSSVDWQDLATRDIKTRYEMQWLDRGKTIKFVAFSLPLEDISFKEPLKEPPYDDYRSLSRGSLIYQAEREVARQKSNETK